jgi:hypothetical protein
MVPIVQMRPDGALQIVGYMPAPSGGTNMPGMQPQPLAMTPQMAMNPVAAQSPIHQPLSVIQGQQPMAPEKPKPVKTADFWDYEKFDLNFYEIWAARACRPCRSCCNNTCVPGTLDNCCCCWPVNCAYSYHQACGSEIDCSPCCMTCYHCPCNLITGPLYMVFHCGRSCTEVHRYNRTIDLRHPATDGDCQGCDWNRCDCPDDCECDSD